MKRYIIAAAFLLSAWGAQAQTRKNVSHFPLFQQYYNPALTGYEGSVVKTFYRNQWEGFEDAPKTIFASAELDLADLRSGREVAQQEPVSGSRQGIGFAVLHDRFGPFTESQMLLSYSSRVRLSDKLSLRWGTAATYSLQNLNGNKLNVDQENDPQYQDAMGQSSRSSKLDLNLGLTLSAENLYVGYAMQDVVKGAMFSEGDEFLKEMYTRKHVVQGGYRHAITGNFGLIAHSIYQYDDKMGSLLEGQLKVVYQNTVWAGAGFRSDKAFSFNAGVRLNQLQLGYAYEMTARNDNRILRMNTNEVMLSYNLFKGKHSQNSGRLTVW